MPRHYTDTEKQLVLERLVANHGDVARTALECGINKRTVYLWLADPKFTDIAHEIAQVKMKNVKNIVKNDAPASPSPSTESGSGGEVLPTETTDAFQILHDKLLTLVHTLSNRIEEAIDEAPLNQRVAALAQLIDRIARLAALLPTEEQEIEYVHEYEYEVEHHVEKEKAPEEGDYSAQETEAED